MNGIEQDNIRNDIQNGSERTTISSEQVRNGSEHVPNQAADRSEVVPNASEQGINNKLSIRETVPNDSEERRNLSEQAQNRSEVVPKRSEAQASVSTAGGEIVRNISEQVRTPVAEQYRTAPACSPQHEGFSITVREAARIFEEAGVPRTERAITNWCNRNARGVTRLDACYHDEERKYYITAESIERVIKEERKKMQYIEYRDGGTWSMEAEELSEQVRDERTEGAEHGERESHTEHEAAGSEDKHRSEREEAVEESTKKNSEQTRQHSRQQEADSLTDEDREKLKELQMENYELRVQLEGQKYLVRQFDNLVDGERERHEREKLALVDRLTDARHEIGTLEQKLLQLEAPGGVVREAEMEFRAEPVDSQSPERGR